MTKTFTLFLLLFVAVLGLQAQNIDWTYASPGAGAGGQEQGFCIVQTPDNGYVFAGRTGPNGLNAGDFYMSKINSSGVFQWSKVYHGQSMDEARAMVALPDGSVVISGVTVNYPDTSIGTTNLQQMIVMKLNPDGDTVWVKTFGGPGADTGDGLDATSDGGFIVCGRYTIASPNNDFYVVKLDSVGTMQWSKTFGGSGSDVARSVQQTLDGGYIVAGTTKSFGTNATTGNMWMAKLNAVGDTTWTEVIGGANEEECYSVKETSDHGFILTGRTGDLTSNDAEVYVVKVGGWGDIEWTKTYGSADNDLGRSIIQTSDGGYALTGQKFTTQGAFPPTLMYVLKMNSDGDKVWDTIIGNYNSPNGAKGYSIIETNDGGLIAVGENDLGNGGLDLRAFVVKFEGTGAPVGIAEEERDKSFVYPNPFFNQAVLVLKSSSDNLMLEIFTSNGQVVLAKKIAEAENQVILNRNELSPGMYFYRVGQAGRGAEYQGRFVIE